MANTSPLTIPEATEVFVKAFVAGKSLYDPYEAVFVDGLWLLRDGAVRRKPRKCEVVAYGLPLPEVHETARSHVSGRWFLCAMTSLEDEDATYSEARSLGFRLMAREGLFVTEARSSARSAGPARRVGTLEDLERLRKASRSRQALDEGFETDDAPRRVYWVLDGQQPVGWVTSVRIGGNSWVSDLYVKEAYRGRGYGRSLMSAMLVDDARLGIERSVLLASQAGARLYPHLGYERLGTLLLFAPPK